MKCDLGNHEIKRGVEFMELRQCTLIKDGEILYKEKWVRRACVSCWESGINLIEKIRRGTR